MVGKYTGLFESVLIVAQMLICKWFLALSMLLLLPGLLLPSLLFNIRVVAPSIGTRGVKDLHDTNTSCSPWKSSGG